MVPGEERFAFPMFFRMENRRDAREGWTLKKRTKQLRANLEGAIRRWDKAVSRLPPSLPPAETVGDGYL